jgi:hypothetical protein
MSVPSATLAAESRRGSLAFDPAGTAGASAVSWAAIFAGAAAAAALSLILLVLGTGLGLSSLSPWANEGASAKTLGIGTAVWVTFMQLAASALGGYLAGRLRTKWVDVMLDEISFRDTAHGFLAWGVATLATAAFLSSTVTSLVSTGVQAGASVAGGAARAVTTGASAGAASAGAEAGKSGGETSEGGPMGYFVDSLFRSPKAARGASGNNSPEASSAEVTRIFANAAASGKLPEEDARYVAQVVSQRTGLSQQEAEKRVNDTFAQMQAKKEQAEKAAREAADKARKASSLASFWLFISFLIGAFVASLCAVYGGRARDA